MAIFFRSPLFAVFWICSLAELAGCSTSGPRDSISVWPDPLPIVAALGAGFALIVLPPNHPARKPAFVIATLGILSCLFTLVFNGLQILGNPGY